MAKVISGNIIIAKYYSATNSKPSRFKLSSRYGVKFVPFNYKYSYTEDLVKSHIKSAKKIGSIGDEEIFSVSSNWNGDIKNV